MNGDMRGFNNTLDTINAAANAIASAGNRLPQSSSVQKTRWGGCWSIYSCFGSGRQRKRIGPAVFVPETTVVAEAPTAQNLNHVPSIILPFFAPPSSPASFLQSEPPSATLSPTGSVTLSANMYSPGGPANIFAIGPYAHETQLVTPPGFLSSTFTTEPGTPFTPPPESLQFTTPSSPEVPFARFLGPNHQIGESDQKFPFSHYDFQSYQLYPGSPVGQLISPSSGISQSGTSSPFPDSDAVPDRLQSLEFKTGNPPKLWNLEKLSPRQWKSQQGSGSLTPDAVHHKPRDGFVLDRQKSDISPLTTAFNGWRRDEIVVNHRVSFEITAEEVVRCVEKKSAPSSKAVSVFPKYVECLREGDGNPSELADDQECYTSGQFEVTHKRTSEDAEEEQRRQKHRSITLGSSKEFNFDSADGRHSDKPTSIGSDWWANENVIGKEVVPSKNWSFFPVMQPGVS